MDDSVQFTDAGLILITIDDETYTLKRPKIGTLRQLDEEWTRIGDDQRANAADPEAEPVDFADRFIAFYRQVFQVLSDKPLPESDDDLPAWFVGAEAGNEWRPKWKAVPWAAGAKPSEQQASAVFSQLAGMTSTLEKIEAAIPLLTSANGTH